ncbi:MAG: hypothetical protein ACR2JK_10430 [Geodermatophilaceae bacterium]
MDTGRGPTALGPASVLIGLVAATVISAPSALAGAPDAAAAADASGLAAPVRGIRTMKVTGSDTDVTDAYGEDVAVDGDYAVVGAAYALDGPGAAYVFSRDGDTWAQEAMLTAPAADARQRFGTSVAISGDSLLVGALPLRSQVGAGYLFDRTTEGWILAATLSDPDPDADQQGEAVALDGDTAVVGASYSDIGPRGNE